VAESSSLADGGLCPALSSFAVFVFNDSDREQGDLILIDAFVDHGLHFIEGSFWKGLLGISYGLSDPILYLLCYLYSLYKMYKKSE
jgi:hypothetical protein